VKICLRTSAKNPVGRESSRSTKGMITKQTGASGAPSGVATSTAASAGAGSPGAVAVEAGLAPSVNSVPIPRKRQFFLKMSMNSSWNSGSIPICC